MQNLDNGSEHDRKLAPTPTDPFLADFEGPNNPGCPKDWTDKRICAIMVSIGLMVFAVTFTSSILSVNVGHMQRRFHVSLVAATLGVVLFVPVCSVSFITSRPVTDSAPCRALSGPIVFGPMSEVFGRRVPLFTGLGLFAMF